MPIVPVKCTNCGANLNVENSKDAAICEFCGSAFIVEKAINNYNVTNNISNNISGSVVNIYGANSTDFIIRAGTLEKYTGASTKVIIPESVTSISGSAFNKCSGLTSITIPNSVTSIEALTFEGCSGLTAITIPNSVTSIGESAFEGCSGLTSITIPNSVIAIDNYAFMDCSGLTSITIPNSVTSIGESVFWCCSELTSVNTTLAIEKFEGTPWYINQCQKADEEQKIEAEQKAQIEQKKSKCYLTTACMEHQAITFDDNCHELTVLRNFRDTYLKINNPQDIELYYATAPKIVESINATEYADEIWNNLYQSLVMPSVDYIEHQQLEEAYNHYKNYSLLLIKQYLS